MRKRAKSTIIAELRTRCRQRGRSVVEKERPISVWCFHELTWMGSFNLDAERQKSKKQIFTA